MYYDGSLVWAVASGESAVELEEGEGRVGHLVVPPRGELVVVDIVDSAGAECGLKGTVEGEGGGRNRHV